MSNAEEVNLTVGSPVFTPEGHHAVVDGVEWSAENRAYIYHVTHKDESIPALWYGEDDLKPASWLSPTGKPTPKWRGNSILQLKDSYAKAREAQILKASVLAMMNEAADARNKEFNLALSEALNRAGIEVNMYSVHAGMHDCVESPILRCIYDESVDRIHDCCIICGDPEERK